MERSIETIWKEGFLKSDALVAPKLNDLYNQKSKHLTEQMKRMFRLNLVYVVGLALFLLVLSILTGVPYVGIFMCLLFLPLFIYGRKQLKKVENLDEGVSSYQYLKAFNSWLKEVIAGYTKIYRFFYPLFFLTLFLGYWSWFSGVEVVMDEIILKYPDLFYTVNGIPVYWALGAILLALLSGIFAGKIYQWDMHVIYGRVFKKLEEILTDMEELRNAH